MSLLGKRHTMLLALMLTTALACAAVLLAAGSTPAYSAEPACDSDPSTPDCLAITSVEPAPGATDVPVGSPDAAIATFNQAINIDHLRKLIRLRNLDTGLGEGGTRGFDSDNRLHVEPRTGSFACGTTYKVIVGGDGNRAVRTDSGLKIREVPAGVTLKRGVASWKFTTAACP